ncbi:MAG: DUF1439 domain-containing protein [Pseudomonadota bacterium]
MDRRLILSALACWPAASLLAQEGAPRPRHKIGAAQLHEALSGRFPVRFMLGSLLEVEVSAPRLLLLSARDKLGAGLVVQVGGMQMQPMPPGEIDLVFALRYEASDQTVRARHPEILALRWPGLPAATLQQLQRSLYPVMREAVGEFVLHKFVPRDLVLADTMGFEPESFRVVDDGVVIVFGPKQGR